MSGAHRPNEEGHGFSDDAERLRVPAVAGWKQEARLLHFLGLRDGMHVLELGCGAGYVTAALAGQWPNSLITAVDHDGELLRLAQALVTNDRVTFVEADAARLPTSADRFDFAIARYLFQHLQDPLSVALEARRALKPQGRLAVIDVDAALWGVAEPAFPEVGAITTKADRPQAECGGDRLIGRRLHRILTAAGFSDVSLDTFVYHSDDLGLAAFEPQLTPDRLLPLVARGLLSDVELQTMRRAYERFMKSPTAFVMMVGFIGSGTKP